MSDSEYREMQQSLTDEPEQGKLIRGGGGIRKMRWASHYSGKSGGFRVLYYYAEKAQQQRLLFIFGKSEQSSLSASQLQQLRSIVDRWE